MPTGEFSVAGGYSTADGFMAELSVGERNLLGQGQYAKIRRSIRPARARLRAVVRRAVFLGYRLGVGVDLYAKQTLASNYVSYDSKTIGGGLRAGFALSEELSSPGALQHLSAGNHAAGSYLNNCQFRRTRSINGGPA